MLTAQEVFDKVVNHLRKQGCQSKIDVNGVPTCLYRGPNGTKCAVGCLISDKEYSPLMEHMGVGLILSPTNNLKLSIKTKKLIKSNLQLLDELQIVHDTNKSWEKKVGSRFINLEKGLKRIAEGFDLVYSSPKKK